MKQNQITAFSTIFEALFSEQQLNSLGVQTHMIERFRLITPAKLCLAFVCALGSGNARTGYRKFNRPFWRVWRVGSGRASAALGTDRAQIGGSCVGFRHRGAAQRLSA